MAMNVGLIGLGLMGRPMGLNLMKAGFSLTVWNRTRERAREFVERGAATAASPRDVAAKSEVLITMVSDPPALEEVLWGPKGAIEGLPKSSVLIDSSTVSPALARRAAAACAHVLSVARARSSSEASARLASRLRPERM